MAWLTSRVSFDADGKGGSLAVDREGVAQAFQQTEGKKDVMPRDFTFGEAAIVVICFTMGLILGSSRATSSPPGHAYSPGTFVRVVGGTHHA